MKDKIALQMATSLLSFLAPVAALAHTASGSDDAQPTSATPAPAAPNMPIGEIIVTANKRAESLSKVGQTITAITAQSLANQRITTLSDIAAAVPGLSYSPSTTNTAIFTLRGVGYNEQSLAVYPTVSVYLDQAPLTFPALASRTAFDLERVEILKGPQGTLFGQNSTGGAVNYIAAKPTDHFSAGGDISYGRFNDVLVNAYVSGPLSSTLKARLAVNGEHADAWQNSTTRSDQLGKTEYIAGRAILDWSPTDTARFEFNINGWKDQSDPQAQQLIAVFPAIAAFVNPALATYPFDITHIRGADWTPTGTSQASRPKSNRDLVQVTLRGDVNITDTVTVTSLTSYVHYRQRQNTDGDGTYLTTFDLGKDDGYIDTIYQELRLSNGSSEPFRWVVGGAYEHSIVDENLELFYGDNSTSNPGTLFIHENGVSSHQRLRSYAAFANGEFAISPTLTLKAGGRYTNSKISQDICNFDPPGAGDQVAQLFSIIGGQTLTEGQCFALDFNGKPGSPYVDTLAEDNFSWRGGIDFKPSDRVLLYANLSRGYKAGNYAVITAAKFDQYAPVTQESVTSYEAGIKLQLVDGRLSINGAGFYYDYKDKQIRGKILDPLFGLLESQVNVPKSRIAGGELEISYRPIKGLTMAGALTYLDSKVNEYTGYDILGTIRNFKGATLPFTPKWQFGGTFDYRWDIGSISPFIGTSVNARSHTTAALLGDSLPLPSTAGVRTAPGITFPYRIPGYTTVDLRAGVEWDDGQYRVMFWGKNIFNKLYTTNVIPSSDTISRFVGRPATYGVTIAVKM